MVLFNMIKLYYICTYSTLINVVHTIYRYFLAPNTSEMTDTYMYLFNFGERGNTFFYKCYED